MATTSPTTRTTAAKDPSRAPPVGDPGTVDGAADPAPAPSPAKAILETVGLVAAPATVLTALGFYFGWLHARTRALGVGLPPEILDYATHDYLLHSVDALFVPVAGMCLLALALLWAHAQVGRRIVTPGRAGLLSRLAQGTAVAGMVLVVVSTLAAFGPAGVQVGGWQLSYARWVLPLGLVAGVASLDYAAQLRHRLAAIRDPAATPRTAGTAPAHRAVLGGLVLLGLFWAVTGYAQDVGEVRLHELRQRGPAWQELPHVVVYSPQDLRLDGPGLTVGHCPPGQSAYGFRYTGLRLFAYSNDKYFLLPAAWPEDGGPAMVLADDPAVRVELLPGHSAADPVGGCPPPA